MVVSRNSERARPRLLAGAALLAVTVVSCAALLRDAQQPRYEGEYGLWVHQAGDSVVVQWLTPQPESGRLEVSASGATVARVETGAGFAHRAAFPTPGDADLVLRYGGAGSEARRFETAVSLALPRRAPAIVPHADSIFVTGDTHGMVDAFVTGAQRAGLIDDALRWRGGRRHLVFAGDMMGRGPDVTGLLWLVYRLEREAAAAGGAVHVVLGNHEIMVLLGDLRYVHPKEAEIATWHDAAYNRMFDSRHSVLGRWLASKPGALRIGDAVIVHGGLDTTYARMGLAALDDTLRTYVAEDLFYLWSDTSAVIPMDSATYQRRDDFFWGPQSLFWHRDYVLSDSAGAALDEALRSIGAATLVVGHTAVDSIQSRYDGRLIAAHTPRYGEELVLLVRDGEGYRRYRVTVDGFVPFQE